MTRPDPQLIKSLLDEEYNFTVDVSECLADASPDLRERLAVELLKGTDLRVTVKPLEQP